MKKDKRATDELNVALAGISSAFVVASTMLEADHPAQKLIETGKQYAEEARLALLTIQFHSAKI